MLFWVAAAILTCITVLALIAPLQRIRRTGGPDSAAAADVAVYRDQLREIDSDRERGLISDEDAEAARIEVSRRLLKAADAAQADRAATTDDPGPRRRLIATAAAACVVPIAAAGLYLMKGRPDLPDQSRAARLQIPVNEMPVTEMLARVEARLAEHPEDGRGWDVIAPIYARVGRLQAAALAYQKAIEINGANLNRVMRLGQLHVRLGGGRVSDSARSLFKQALSFDPTNVEAAYWLAAAHEQRGNRAAAAQGYRDLLTRSDIPGEWRDAIGTRLAAVASAPTDQERDRSGSAGPSQDDVAAANQMTAEQRREMIEGMVARLAQRLDEDGSDPAAWVRLVRSYLVLGDRARAVATIDRARTALVDNAQGLAEINKAAEAFGLAGGDTETTRVQ